MLYVDFVIALSLIKSISDVKCHTGSRSLIYTHWHHTTLILFPSLNLRLLLSSPRHLLEVYRPARQIRTVSFSNTVFDLSSTSTLCVKKRKSLPRLTRHLSFSRDPKRVVEWESKVGHFAVIAEAEPGAVKFCSRRQSTEFEDFLFTKAFFFSRQSLRGLTREAV